MRKKRNIKLIILTLFVVITMSLLAKASIDFVSDKAKVAIEYTVNMIRSEAIEPEMQKVEAPSKQLNFLNDELSNIVLSLKIGGETITINTSFHQDEIIEIDSLYSD